MKDIYEYDEYSVTADGKVFSNNYHRENISKQLRSWVTYNGYEQVHLRRYGKRKAFSVHRLVAQTYLPNPKNLPFVNHKNGIKTDNRQENLEWCTASDNSKHNFKIGLQKPRYGKDNHSSKITQIQAQEIRTKYVPRKYSQARLAKEYGLRQQTVCELLQGKTWS